MDVSKLIRDPARIHACLQELPDTSLIAVKPVKIYIPQRWNDRGLASVGIETYIIGIYAITSEDAYYGISLVPSLIKINPSSTNIVTVQGEAYYEFVFDAGTVITERTELVKNDVLIYRVFTEMKDKGRVPWYVSYEDDPVIMENANYYSGAGVGREPEVNELLTAIVARDPANLNQNYRHVVQSADYVRTHPCAWISLRNIRYAATNTVDKLAGSYFTEGLVGALVSPADRTENIENLLRQ